MISSCLGHKSARNGNEGRGCIHGVAIELRKSKVVTNRKGNRSEGRLSSHRFFTRREVMRLTVGILSFRPQVDVKEMHLSITSDPLSFRRKNETGIVNPGVTRNQFRKSPADQPNLVSSGRVTKESDDFSVLTLRTGKGCSLAPHEGEIFWQRDEFRPLGRSPSNRLAGPLEIPLKRIG